MVSAYAETGTLKIPAVVEYVVNLKEGGSKFLVFAHHLNVMDAIAEALKVSAAHSCGVITSPSSSSAARMSADIKWLLFSTYDAYHHSRNSPRRGAQISSHVFDTRLWHWP